jgi:hypothetical protein
MPEGRAPLGTLDDVVELETDAPYARGRLVITPVGAGRFAIEVVRGADKWVLRAPPTIVAGICPKVLMVAKRCHPGVSGSKSSPTGPAC